MASFEIQGFDDFEKELSLLDADRIIPMMLEESVPILEANVKRRASAHRVTGAMVNSIKATKASVNSRGHYISVRPTGTDSKGVRNMEKLIYNEYGTSKQAASPILSAAVRESEEPVVNKMQEVFNRETGG